MAHQLTILNSSDNSFVEAFFVTHPLHQELTRISRIFELESLDLAFLNEIRLRAQRLKPLSRLAAVCPIRGCTCCSRQLKSVQPKAISALASQSLVWFDELLSLINAIQQLQKTKQSLLIML